MPLHCWRLARVSQRPALERIVWASDGRRIFHFDGRWQCSAYALDCQGTPTQILLAGLFHQFPLPFIFGPARSAVQLYAASTTKLLFMLDRSAGHPVTDKPLVDEVASKSHLVAVRRRPRRAFLEGELESPELIVLSRRTQSTAYG
jgi:hypothetical protein